jgi:hypothetical protein
MWNFAIKSNDIIIILNLNRKEAKHNKKAFANNILNIQEEN